MEPAGIKPLTLESGYILLSLPTIVPGLSTLPQPTSTLSPRNAPIFLIPVSILAVWSFNSYKLLVRLNIRCY